MSVSQLGSQEVPADLLYETEARVRSGPDDVSRARAPLRQWFISQCGDPRQTGSIAEVLQTLAGSKTKAAYQGAVALRYLSVSGIFPNASEGNQLARSISTIAEETLPAVCSFLRIIPKQQNYEKFQLLESAHQKICAILTPLKANYGDAEALLQGRRQILGALAHSAVREYCDVFKVNEVRSIFEAVFSKIAKAVSPEATLLNDYDECIRALDSARASVQEIGTFLSYEFLGSFVDAAQSTLRDHLTSLRSRLGASIGLVNDRTSLLLNKRYPLNGAERDIHVAVPLKNSGPGLALDVQIVASTYNTSVTVIDYPIMIGSVRPGPFSISIEVLTEGTTTRLELQLEVSWTTIGSELREDEIFEVVVNSQVGEVAWGELAYWSPYSTDVAEGSDFVGRRERLEFLASKILRLPMEPFYITGQKRVGKTSLAKSAPEFAQQRAGQSEIISLYILWGAVAHANPSDSLHALGKTIEETILSELGNAQLFPGDYHGSLSGLVKLADTAFKIAAEKRFVVIIDEFDEIPPELYLQGNLAETFFGNLRALSRCKNVCLVLVGGENMPFVMDRQGQKLNNFSRINLNSYSRANEWEDFQLLVRKPSTGKLTWHDEAINAIFYASNGNPYFAKIVCAQAARNAVSKRDSDIDADEVKIALDSEISLLGSNFFSHLWRDGVSKPLAEQEPDILKRMRVLVAFARCARKKSVALTAANIAEAKSSSALTSGEVLPVLNDFVRREVMTEISGRYDIVIPIFRDWLLDVGAGQLVSDSLSEELSNSVIAEENVAIIKSNEVLELVSSWPTYRGQPIGTDNVRAWLDQVPNARDQRILFRLLQRTTFLSEAHIRERLKAAHTMIRPILPDFIIRHRNERRNDVLVTYIDGPGKSGALYASLYAETNGIAATSVVAPDSFRNKFTQHVSSFGRPAALLIVDDIAASGDTLEGNLSKFIVDFGDLLNLVKVRALTIISTAEAQNKITKQMANFNTTDFDLRSCELLPERAKAFPENEQVWDGQDEEERAKALCLNLGSRISKQRPLGYGKMGLLVVFPTTVPNNSLPILHSFARAGSGMAWTPLFLRPNN